MARTSINHEQKKIDIMMSTLQLFTEKGYEDTSMSDIMKATQLSKGAIYHYFDSKEDILNSILNFIITTEIQLIEPLLNDDKISKLNKLVSLIYADNSGKTTESQEVFNEVVKRPKSLFEYKVKEVSKTRFIPILTSVINEGINNGEFSTKYAEETAQVLYTAGETIGDFILNGVHGDLLKPKVEGFAHVMSLNLGLDQKNSEFLLETLYKKLL